MGPIELLATLLAFVLFVAIWAAMGHAIWLVLAAIGKSCVPAPVTLTPDPCPSCGRSRAVSRGRCLYCGVSVAASSARATNNSESTDRVAVERYLQYCLAIGRITPVQHEHLRDMLMQNAPIAQVTLVPTTPEPSPADAEVTFVEDAPSPLQFDLAATEPEQPAIVPPPRNPWTLPERPPPALERPSQPLANMLQAFFEERNIRWGEVLAGLFIVVSAVGLIISLRNTLQAIPYFPALMFMLFTVMFHGAGLYSLRKWKLHAVSRVVLIISLLLVPLSFGAGLVLSGGGEAMRPLSDPIVIAGVCIALGVFSWVTWSAARELVRHAAWELSLAVMGTALSQIVINRSGQGLEQSWSFALLAALPLACFVIACGSALLRYLQRTQPTRRANSDLIVVASISFFATVAPLILLFTHVDQYRQALAELTPFTSGLAALWLAIGLVLRDGNKTRPFAIWRTMGVALAILSSVALLALLVVAWPWAGMLMVVGLIDGVLLITLALVLRIPLLHCGGLVAFTVAYVVGVHGIKSSLSLVEEATSLELLRHGLSAATAVALLPWNFAVFAVWLVLKARPKLWRDARSFRVTAAGLAVVTLGVAVNAGFAQELAAGYSIAISFVLLAYAALLSGIAVGILGERPRYAWFTCFSAAVGWLAIAHGVEVSHFGSTAIAQLAERLPPFCVSTLLHALATAVGACVVARRFLLTEPTAVRSVPEHRRWQLVVEPLVAASFLVSIAAGLLIFTTPAAFSDQAAAVAVVATTWLLLTGITRSLQGMIASQLAFHVAAALALAGAWQGDSESLASMINDEFIAAQLTIHAALATLWTTVRLAAERMPTLHTLLASRKLTTDGMVLACLAIFIFLFSILCLAPAIAHELGAELSAEVPTIAASLATNPWVWSALAAIAIGFGLRCWEHFSVDALAALAVVLTSAAVVDATAWSEESATGAALRWICGVLVMVAAVPWLWKDQCRRLLHVVPRWQSATFSLQHAQQLRFLVLGLLGLPIVVITGLALGLHINGAPLVEPSSGSHFAPMGTNLSYGAPLLALVIVFASYAVREQDSRYMLAATSVFQGAINVALLWHLADYPFHYTREAAVLALQVNAIASGLFCFVWLLLDRWIRPIAEQRQRVPRPIEFSILYHTRLVLVLGLWGAAAIIVSPTWQAPWDYALGGWLSFVALGLSAVSIAWRYAWRGNNYGLQGLILLAACLVPLAAVAADQLPAARPWQGYIVLETAWLGLGLLATLAAWACHRITHRTNPPPEQPRLADSVSRRSLAQLFVWRAALLTVVGGAMATYAGWLSPANATLSLTLLALVQVALLCQGPLTRSEAFPYVALLFAICMGGVIWWVQSYATPEASGLALPGYIGCSISVATALWLGITVAFQRFRDDDLDRTESIFPMHRTALYLLAMLGGLCCVAAWGLQLVGHVPDAMLQLRTITPLFFALWGLLLVGSLWDRYGRVPELSYMWAILAVATAVPAVHLELLWSVVALCVAVGIVVAGSSLWWKWGVDVARLGLRWGIHDPLVSLLRVSRWLPATNLAIAATAVTISVVLILLLPQRDMRFTLALVPLLAAVITAALAQGARQRALLVATYLLAVVAAVAAGWADVQPGHGAPIWFDRSVRLLMACCVGTLVYGLFLPRWFFTFGPWHDAARRAAPIAGGIAIVTLLAIMSQELALFQPKIGSGISLVQLTAISIVLLGLAAGMVSLALLPDTSSLSFNAVDRQFYVYGAESVAALLFLHVYLARPNIFDTTLRPYWPYIVLLVAFAGVGVSEMLQRSRFAVLSQPLGRTSFLLPVLPALGMWFLASRSDYSTVLFVSGLMYLLLSYRQRSSVAGIAAAVAGNASLWTWLAHDQAHDFFAHPQWWLIPPAVSVLLASHWERGRLPGPTFTAIRYAATLVIYVSSTSEMFVAGLNESLWPPMILGLLSLGGIVLGMLLQIRPFLYLGTAFVLLALVSMVSHAARAIDHVWPWWAFGIGVGIAILVLFGFFEKRRADVNAALERLRQWED